LFSVLLSLSVIVTYFLHRHYCDAHRVPTRIAELCPSCHSAKLMRFHVLRQRHLREVTTQLRTRKSSLECIPPLSCLQSPRICLVSKCINQSMHYPSLLTSCKIKHPKCLLLAFFWVGSISKLPGSSHNSIPSWKITCKSLETLRAILRMDKQTKGRTDTGNYIASLTEVIYIK